MNAAEWEKVRLQPDWTQENKELVHVSKLCFIGYANIIKTRDVTTGEY